MRTKRLVMAVGMILLMIAGSAFAEGEVKREIGKRLNTLSVPFIKNEGQTDREVKYYVKTFGGTLFVTEQGKLVYSLPKYEERGRGEYKEKEEQTKTKLAVIAEELIGAEVKEVKTEGVSETRVNYFIGNDPKKHRNEIKTYDTVSLGEVYNGIELRLKAYANNVEKLFYVRPEARPEEIKVGIRGSKGIRVNQGGELVVETALGEVKFTKPVAYQEIGGRKVEVAVEYGITDSANSLSTPSADPGSGVRHYVFMVKEYDKTKELVIDPLLQSTFLGGNEAEESRGIAIHPATGDVYVTGYTQSNDFPGIAGGADTTFGGFNEAFVSRLNSTLTTLHQSTYLGGSSYDYGNGIAIHPATGDVYVTGYTQSNDFPGIAGGVDTTFGGLGTSEGFVSRLNSTLTTLHQSTFLGGSMNDSGWGIAIHPTTGDVYVTGETDSDDFPGIAGGADTTLGWSEAFVSRLDSTLTTLHQSTYLGGDDLSDWSNGKGIAIHPATGDVYVIGNTMSDDFPGIAGGADTTFAGDTEVYVSRLNSGLTTLHQSTFLGGSSGDTGNGIAIHPASGDVYAAGYTDSNDFPGIAGGADTTFVGIREAFVSRLNSGLTTLHQSTFLGGNGNDRGNGIAIHPITGDVYVAGATGSNDFPGISGGADTTIVDIEAFVSRLDSTLKTLHQSTYLGGSGIDQGYGIAIHPATGDVYVTGATGWWFFIDFPGIAGGADTTFELGEAFVSRLTSSLMAVDPTPEATTTSASSASTTFSGISQNITLNASVTDSTTVGEGIVTFTLKEGATVIGSAVQGLVVNGISSVTYSLPGGTAVGSYTIEASYGGGVSFQPSSTNLATVTIEKASAVITLGNLSHTYDGTPKSATATTNPGGLTVISITYDGSATPPTNAGSYGVVASLSNPNYQATNATGTLVISKANTTTSAVSSLNPSISGESVTFTATVNVVAPGGGTPTGTVTFRDGAADLGTGTLNGSGQTTFTTSALAAGTRSVTAQYNGDSNFNASTSSGLDQVVRPTTVTIPSATGPGDIILTTNSPGCWFSNVQVYTEAQAGDDPGYNYPYGLVGFTVNCIAADVSLTFTGATDLSGWPYRRHGPTTPGDPLTTKWYTYPDVTIVGNTVTLRNLRDGQFGDDTGVDGVIVDQGGPGQFVPVAPVPTMTEWGVIILLGLIAMASIYSLRRRMSGC